MSETTQGSTYRAFLPGTGTLRGEDGHAERKDGTIRVLSLCPPLGTHSKSKMLTLEVWDEQSVVVGHADGTIAVYSNESGDPLCTATLGSKPIEQIARVGHLLIARFDNSLKVYRLSPDREARFTFTLIDEPEQGRSCYLFATNKGGLPYPAVDCEDSSLYLAIANKKRPLVILQWDPRANRFQLRADLPVTETIRTMEFIRVIPQVQNQAIVPPSAGSSGSSGSLMASPSAAAFSAGETVRLVGGASLCLAIKNSYYVVMLSTGSAMTIELPQPGRPVKSPSPPVMTQLPHGTLLLFRENAGYCINEDGSPANISFVCNAQAGTWRPQATAASSFEPQIIFSEPPVSVSYVHPFIVGLLPSTIEVCLLGSHRPPVQVIQANGAARLTSRIVPYLFAPGTLRTFAPINYQKLIRDLVRHGDYPLALQMIDLSPPSAWSSPQDRLAKINEIKVLEAYRHFNEGNFEIAMISFQACKYDPRRVLSLFPVVLPSKWSLNVEHPIQEVQRVEEPRAIYGGLIPYLNHLRSAVLRSISNILRTASQDVSMATLTETGQLYIPPTPGTPKVQARKSPKLRPQGLPVLNPPTLPQTSTASGLSRAVSAVNSGRFKNQVAGSRALEDAEYESESEPEADTSFETAARTPAGAKNAVSGLSLALQSGPRLEPVVQSDIFNDSKPSSRRPAFDISEWITGQDDSFDDPENESVAASFNAPSLQIASSYAGSVAESLGVTSNVNTFETPMTGSVAVTLTALERSALIRDAVADFLSNAGIEKPTPAILQQIRDRLMACIPKADAELLVLVDTILLRCHILTNEEYVSDFIEQDCYCDLEDVAPILCAHHLYSELVKLYYKQGNHRAALDLLRGLAQSQSQNVAVIEPKRMICGRTETVNYLRSMLFPEDRARRFVEERQRVKAKPDGEGGRAVPAETEIPVWTPDDNTLDMIFEYSRWLFETRIEESVRMFIPKLPASLLRQNEASHDVDIIENKVNEPSTGSKSPKSLIATIYSRAEGVFVQPGVTALSSSVANRILLYLKALLPPEEYVPFLESSLQTGDVQVARYHDELALSYLNQLVAHAMDVESPAYQTIRKRLLEFLQYSQHYNANKLIERLPENDLYEERALVLARLNRWPDVLAMYIDKLGDLTAAEEYADHVFRKSGDTTPYLRLMEAYLSRGGALDDNAKEFLLRCCDKLSPALVLRELPSTCPIDSLVPFLQHAFASLSAKKRGVQITKYLIRAEVLDHKLALGNQTRPYALVTKDSLCGICDKPISDSAIVLSHGSSDPYRAASPGTSELGIFHYGCYASVNSENLVRTLAVDGRYSRVVPVSSLRSAIEERSAALIQLSDGRK